MFVPLHVKSDYSFGYGTAGVDELVRRAAAVGYPALALTDLENLCGQVRFQKQCRLHGIRPITGVELRPGFAGQGTPGSREGRVVLLALEASGYQSLCRIVSERRTGPSRTCGDPLPLVIRHADGLFALSDDPAVIERLLASARFPPDRLGLFMVRPASSRSLSRSSSPLAERGVALVGDLDAVFPLHADHPLHLLQHAVASGRSFEEAAASPDVEGPDRWLRTPRQAAQLFADRPDLLENADRIAKRCRFELGGDRELHPFFFQGREPDHGELVRITRAALAERARGDGAKRYRERLERELAVFGALGFSGFMLAAAAILGHCREQGIPVAVRGSAVSSLVLHLLGGSPVDPVREGLLFERFLHPGKSAWPDVDIDLPWHRRDEVIAWVYRHFGADRVAMVAAHHTFQARSALREGLKALGVSAEVIERLARRLPREEGELSGTEGSGAEEAGGALPAEFTNGAIERAYPSLSAALPLVRRLVGRPRHLAVHPGGIVLDRFPLADRLPLERSAKGVVIAQYDLVAAAELGLVELDLLGNRCLSEIEEGLRLAGWREPIRLSDIPAEDPATLALIDRAQTVGCFQLETPAMRSLLARLPVRRQSDLIAALALIRPGAASGEVKEAFLRRTGGEEPSAAVFPALVDRLAESHGLLIYEEDIMVLLHRTGGLTLAEADETRRAIVKLGGDAAALAALGRAFLETARRRLGNAGATAARARRAWTVAARFAAYSFNKAHAASYALLSYYSAYLKAHHPVELACALLNHHQGLYPLRVEVSEFLRIGVPIRGPHVNRSRCRSVVVESAGTRWVTVGLDRMKRLSRRSAEAIVAEREAGGAFASLAGLLGRVKLAANEVRSLVLGGACDGIHPLPPQDYPFAHEAALAWLQRGGKPAGLDRLRYRRGVAETEEERARLHLFQGLSRVRNELEYLGMHLYAHPMALLRAEAARVGCITVREAGESGAETRVRVAAVLAALRRVPTRRGALVFVTLEDETGLMEGVVLPTRENPAGLDIETPGPYLVEGRMRLKQGALHLEVAAMRPFHERSRS